MTREVAQSVAHQAHALGGAGSSPALATRSASSRVMSLITRVNRVLVFGHLSTKRLIRPRFFGPMSFVWWFVAWMMILFSYVVIQLCEATFLVFLLLIWGVLTLYEITMFHVKHSR